MAEVDICFCTTELKVLVLVCKNRRCAGPSQRGSLLHLARLSISLWMLFHLVLCLFGNVGIWIIRLLTVSFKAHLSVLCSRAQRLGFSRVLVRCAPGSPLGSADRERESARMEE